MNYHGVFSPVKVLFEGTFLKNDKPDIDDFRQASWSYFSFYQDVYSEITTFLAGL